MKDPWMRFLPAFVLAALLGCERGAGTGAGPQAAARESLPLRSAPAPASRPTAAQEEGIIAARPPARERASGRAQPASSFVDVAAEAGVAHRHHKGEFDPKLSNIMPWIASIGAAAAAADYDGDGDLDLYVSNSRAGVPNALYRNDSRGGELRFTEVAREAGVAAVNDQDGVTMDVAFGDIENDGDPDLYIVKWGRNLLFRNDGGRFTDITQAAGVGDRGNGNCGLFFDHDNDGFLDLLVCNYFPDVDLMKLEHTRILHDSFEHARNGGPNRLFHNNRDGTFTDVAHPLNLDDTGWSLDAGISDLDNDGDLDLYIANDFGQDRLYLNPGDGAFIDVTARAIGRENAKGMNADMGDFDGDGFTDIYVANITTEEYLKEGNFLWLNGGDGTFINVAGSTGAADGGWGWCGRFLDYDADGDLDLFTVNGFVSASPKESYWEALATAAVNPAFDPAEAAQWPAMGNRSLSGYETSRLFKNRGDGSFAETAVKEGIADRLDGRGIAVGDYDGDGDLDLYIANQDQPACLYRNEIGATHHWLQVTLVGSRSNRDAIGARLEAQANGLRLVREVNGVNGFASQSALAVHFGLAQAGRVERLRIFWPSGVVQEFGDLEADRHLVIEERGEPRAAAERLPLYLGRRKAGREAVRAEPAQGERGAALVALERGLRRKPRNAGLANAYRARARELGLHDREIEFFRELIKQRAGRPVPPALRLQLALALIDKIPAQNGDILAQGSLAKESLAELAEVLEAQPGSFAAHYVAGMNHLYWPESLRHAPDALRHFARCREIAAAGLPGGGGLEECELPLLVAAGDALVKQKDLAAARAQWQKASARFPGSKEVADRLRMGDGELERYVRELRGLSRPIDTSLKVLELENGLAAAEARLLREPEDRAALEEYRLEAGEIDALDRGARFLAELLDRAPGAAEPRLALALIHLDQAGAAGGETAEASLLAAEAERRLGEYRARQPGDWRGPYLGGLVRLHFPSAGPAAAATVGLLEEAVRLSQGAGGRPRVAGPLVALGDALARAGRIGEAREAWKLAAEAFPKLEGARARLAAAGGALAALLEAAYDPRAGVPTGPEVLLDLEGELEALEASLRAAFARREADRYRELARRSDDPERAGRLFRALVAVRPRSAGARVQLALALIDRMPDRTLGSVQRGLLSSEALEALAPAARGLPEAFGVHYLIGVIHLNWFTKQKHVPSAIEAFDRCLELGGGQHRPLAHQAIGDALVKDKRFPLARRRWQEGEKEFPGNKGLEERLGQTSLMVEGYVERLRSWESPQDTGLLSRVAGDLPDLPDGAPPMATAGKP